MLVKILPLPVVLDTNFLTVPAQFGIDVFSEAERILERSVEFILLKPVIREIKSKLKRTGAAESRLFKVALELAERCIIIEIDQSMSDLTVDDQLLDYTVSVNGVLATNDKELRKRAITKGIPVLVLRGKKHLELIGTIF